MVVVFSATLSPLQPKLLEFLNFDLDTEMNSQYNNLEWCLPVTRCLFFVLTHLHFNNLINCYLSCCLHIVASLVCKRESVWLPDTDEVSQFQAETTCSNACCLCQRQNLRSTSGKWLWVVVFLQLYLHFSPVNVSHESMSNWPSWWHHGWENLYLLFSDNITLPLHCIWK